MLHLLHGGLLQGKTPHFGFLGTETQQFCFSILPPEVLEL